MLPVTLSAFFLAAGASAAALQPRASDFVCHHFFDQCVPNLTIDIGGDDVSYHMRARCRDASGTLQPTTEIDMNECLGNQWGKLVSGGNFGYSCHGVEPIYEGGHGRSPFGIHCADGGDSSDGEDYSPFTIIDLDELFCADSKGQLRCQNQYDNHLHGL